MRHPPSEFYNMNSFPTDLRFFVGSSGASVDLNPAPSKITRERAPVNSKAGAPGCYIEGLKKAKEPIPVERETAQLRISVIA
jgi:hypothetical protein